MFKRPKSETSPKRRGRPRWILPLVLLLLIGGGFFAFKKFRKSGDTRPTVRTAVVTRGDVRTTVSATGTLQPFTMFDVKSKAGGKVIKMAVEEGTRVKKGQLICLIDTEDVNAAFKQAAADVQTQSAALRQSKQNLRLQNTIIGPQIQQADEAVATATARLQQARENLTLQKAVNGPQIAQAKDAVVASQARLAQAQEALAQQRSTSEATVAAAESGVGAAQARLDQAEAEATAQPKLSQGAIDQAQAGVDSAQANVRSAEEARRQLTAASQPQAVAAAQAAVDQAQSDVTTTDLNYKRQKALLDRGFVAQSVVDAAQNQLINAQANLRTVKTRLDTIVEEQASQRRDADARLEQARGSLNQAQAGLKNARTNTVQDDLRMRDVTAARAALGQAKNSLTSAQAERRQVAVRQAEVNAALATLRQSKSALENVQANSRQINVKAGDVDSAAAALRQSQAALRTARANTIQSNVKAEDVAQANARLSRAEVTAQNARNNLEQTTVVSPSDGIVLKKYVDEGTIIQSGLSGFSAGSPIVQLADVTRIYVDTQVDESDIALIEPGQAVDITLDAYPNSPKSGKVRKIYPQAEVNQNVTYIRAQVEIDSMDVDERLRPSMNATCEFLIEEKENVLTVPSEAVKEMGEENQITVIKDPKLPAWRKTNQEVRKVEVGLRGDEQVEIIKGVKEGETIVTQIIQPVTTAPGAAMGGGAPRGAGAMGGGGGRRQRF